MTITITIAGDTPQDILSTMQGFLRGAAQAPSSALVSTGHVAVVQENAAAPVYEEGASDNKAKPTTRKAKKEEAVSAPEPAPEPAPVQETEQQAISTGEARIDPAQEALAEAEDDGVTETAEQLDYDTVVMPLVLKFASIKGRDEVLAAISLFGGEAKASTIAPEKMAPFVAYLRKALNV